MLPVNRVYAPIFYPPTQAQLDVMLLQRTEAPHTAPAPAPEKYPFLNHSVFGQIAAAPHTIEHALDDLNMLPLHNVNRPCWPKVELHPESQYRALRAQFRRSEASHQSPTGSASPQHKTYARAHAFGALYTEAIVQYGAAQAGSSEYCYLFLERVLTLAPSLARHFSKIVFWQPDEQGTPRAKHSALLFDGLPRINRPNCETDIPPNQTVVLTLPALIRSLHFGSPRFALIDPSGLRKLVVFDSTNSFDQSAEQVFDMLHNSGAEACNADLTVSFALELGSMPREYFEYSHQARRSSMHALEEVVVEAPGSTSEAMASRLLSAHTRLCSTAFSGSEATPNAAPSNTSESVRAFVSAPWHQESDLASWSAPHRSV